MIRNYKVDANCKCYFACCDSSTTRTSKAKCFERMISSQILRGRHRHIWRRFQYHPSIFQFTQLHYMMEQVGCEILDCMQLPQHTFTWQRGDSRSCWIMLLPVVIHSMDSRLVCFHSVLLIATTTQWPLTFSCWTNQSQKKQKFNLDLNNGNVQAVINLFLAKTGALTESIW